MRFKKYYKDILSLVGTLLLLGTTILINKYDVKQLYREFATLSLKVNAQENGRPRMIPLVHRQTQRDTKPYAQPSARDDLHAQSA